MKSTYIYKLLYFLRTRIKRNLHRLYFYGHFHRLQLKLSIYKRLLAIIVDDAHGH